WRLARLELAAAAVHDVAFGQVHLSGVRELFSIGLGLVNALGLGDGRGQAAAAAGRRAAVPRPLAIDIHELADPILVALTDSKGAGGFVAELEAPARIVAEADHVGNVRRLRGWRRLLLAGGSGT